MSQIGDKRIMKTKQQNDVRSFLKRAKNDSQLRERLQQIKQPTGPKRLAEVVRIATESGYNFSQAEYEEAARAQLALKSPATCNFTEEQIASVAGCMN